MAVTFRISELAADLAVTTRTIRFYEEQGLISPSRRGHERIYTTQERHLLRIALTGKQLGLTLAECRELLELFQTDDANVPSHDELHQQLDRVAHYQQFLSEQKRAIGTLTSTLNEIKSRCQRSFDTRLAMTEAIPSGEEQPSLFNVPSSEKERPSYTSEEEDASDTTLIRHTDDEVTETDIASDPTIGIVSNDAVISDTTENENVEISVGLSAAQQKEPHVAPAKQHARSTHQHDHAKLSSTDRPSLPEMTQKGTAPMPDSNDLDLFAPLENDLGQAQQPSEKQHSEASPVETPDVVVEDDGQLGFLL